MMWRCCECHTNLPLWDKGDGALPGVAVRIMNLFTSPPFAYEPYGPNGVRQMGGDHAGVYKECVCVHTWADAHVCAGLFLNFVHKVEGEADGGSGVGHCSFSHWIWNHPSVSTSPFVWGLSSWQPHTVHMNAPRWCLNRLGRTLRSGPVASLLPSCFWTLYCVNDCTLWLGCLGFLDEGLICCANIVMGCEYTWQCKDIILKIQVNICRFKHLF